MPSVEIVNFQEHSPSEATAECHSTKKAGRTARLLMFLPPALSRPSVEKELASNGKLDGFLTSRFGRRRAAKLTILGFVPCDRTADTVLLPVQTSLFGLGQMSVVLSHIPLLTVL